MASKRLFLYAADIYKLSSLLLRRVLLTKPATLTAYREKTRQLLLDESRPSTSPTSSAVTNEAAVKLLEWDREWNLIRYYGVGYYAKRWWISRSHSSFSVFSDWRITNGGDSSNKEPESLQDQGNESATKKHVARVAFMITSNQRLQLSTKLGYNSQDIRSFKPIEALLLLEHGMKKEHDFRLKLKRLVDENERLTKIQHQTQPQQSLEKVDDDACSNRIESSEDGSKTNPPIEQSISSEEAEQIHAKPDVAIALQHANDQQDDPISTGGNRWDDVSSAKFTGINNTTMESSIELKDEHTSAAGNPQSPATSSSPVMNNITPQDSEELHMKPDVAAAILASKQQNKQQGDEQPFLMDGEEEVNDDDGPCWYEVIETVPTKPPTFSTIHDDRSIPPACNATKDERVIALFPTKKEALECVQIKQSFRSTTHDVEIDGKGSMDDMFLVRRRWNV